MALMICCCRDLEPKDLQQHRKLRVDALGNEIRGLAEDETSRLVEGVCAPALLSSERRLNDHVEGDRAALVEKNTLIINYLTKITSMIVMSFML